MKILITKTVVFIGLMFVSFACKEETVAPQTQTGQISLLAKYSVVSTLQLNRLGNPYPLLFAVDSIKVTRFRVVLKRIKFESDNDSVEFKTAPMVVEYNISGAVHEIAVSAVKFGTYREIGFKIHRVNDYDLDDFTPAERAPFADFLAGERYSMIIDGMVFKDGSGGQPFTYRSRVNEEQKYNFNPPLAITSSNPNVTVTLRISSGGWFLGHGGVLLDPRDPRNQDIIDQNLKVSIKVFRDDDRDGDDD
ncbi:MAG: hypothetical protein KJ666_10820 [Bacteroidetes bacterium]|nr:hypothetical protein [Bacteroidota bacterium]